VTVTATAPAITTARTTADSTAYSTGYPHVVAVSELPAQVRNWYTMENYTSAVAVAPGVWTPLSQGATMQDALSSDVLDGFCASVKAFERQYRSGQSSGGTCW
jgi:hypothetical protein